MRKSIIFSVIVVLIVFSAVKSQSQNNMDSVMTKEEVADLFVSVYETPAHKFLLKSLGNPESKGFRVVFVYSGKRYTVDHNWHMGGLQVWYRPEGTYHPNPKAEAFVDKNEDGVIDWSWETPKEGETYIELFPGMDFSTGGKHQPVYNEMLTGLKTIVG